MGVAVPLVQIKKSLSCWRERLRQTGRGEDPMPCVETAGLVRAALLRDLVAPRVCRTRVAPAQNDQEGEQSGIHRPLRRSSAWQARETTSRRTAVAGHGPRPAPAAAVPGPAATGRPWGGNPRLPPASSPPQIPQKTLMFPSSVSDGKRSNFESSKSFKRRSPPGHTGQSVHVGL